MKTGFRYLRAVRGLWAISDQGLVSLGNFLTQIILARSLSRSEYGVFTLFFGVLLVLFVCQGSLITYPLSLRGATVGIDELQRLTSGSLVLTILLVIPLAPLVFGTAWVLKKPELGWAALLAMAVWQLQETLRRALMAHLRHRDAIWGDALGYLGQAVVLWVLAYRGQLTLETAFLTIAATSAAAALLQGIQLGLASIRLPEVLSLARKYWPMGRWALFTGLSETGSRQAFPWALALLFGPQEAASFQAAMNVLGVSHPVLFGTSNLIIPAAAESQKRAGTRAAFRTSSRYGVVAMALVLPYFVGLFFLPHQALSLFYGRSSAFTALGTGVRLAVLAYFFGICGAFLSGYLFGVGRPKYVFVATAGSAALAFVPAAILMVRYGAIGAIAGFLVWMFIRMAWSLLFAQRTLRQEHLFLPVAGSDSSASHASLKGADAISSTVLE